MFSLFIINILFCFLVAETPAVTKPDVDPPKPQTNGLDTNPPATQPTPIPGTVPTQPLQNATSENGIPVAATAEEVKDRGLPKAMVKPQVLTHVISDFVIQESSEPFPVTRSTILSDLRPSQTTNDNDEPPSTYKKYFF